MKRRVFLLAVLFSALLAMEAYAGQFKSNETGIWYENDDGTYPTGWFQDEVGHWYCFDENGYARTGWFEENGVRYYLGKNDGRLFVNCASILAEGCFLFDENGAATQVGDDYRGWFWDGSYWYYRQGKGAFGPDGWREIDGVRYYFTEGHLLTGPAEIDGKQYFFDENGKQKTGLIVWDNVFYYINEDGSPAKGTEIQADGKTYIFDENGVGTLKEEKTIVGTGMNFVPGEDWPYKAVTAIPPDSEKSELHRTCDQMADQILAGIVNDNMNERQKAEAIYAWVRGNLRYSGAAATRDWVREAYQGLRTRRGDCFTYYSVSQLLLSRVGIASIEVLRYTDNHHYWNLVNIDGSWYHFDATPRRAGGYFCLWTDAQMENYSRKHGNCFAFDRSLYPRTP